MKNIADRAGAVGFLALLVLGANTASQAQVNIPLDRKVGEIFVAIGDGQYQVWDFSGTTSTLVETITNGALTDNNAGCGSDSTYHPFTTNVTANDVFRHGIYDPQNPIRTTDVTLQGGAQPTSVAFDSLGDSYFGVGGGNGLIEKYGPSGTFIRTLPVGVNELKGGSPWMDLSTDAQTIYFTNLSNTITQFNVSSSKTSKFASISGATLHGLRILPAATQTATGGLLLVAGVFSGSSNIQLLNSSGSTIKTYSVTTPVNETNFQVVTLDPNGTSFWAGNPTTHNFYRFNLASGAIEVGPIPTGAGGPNGLCAYGGFSAAQPQRTTVTAALTPSANTANTTCTAASSNNTMDCTFSTVVPPPTTPEACPTTATTEPTNNCFGITLHGINLNPGHAPNGLQLVYNYSQIAQAAGTSDTGLICDLTSPDGTKCEVHSVDVTPNNLANGDTSIYQNFDVEIFSTQTAVNPVGLKNELTDLTTWVHHQVDLGDSDTTGSIFTVNEQPIQVTGSQSCGYISPIINSMYNKGRTIPFKFQAIAAGGSCSTEPFLRTLNPRLVLLQVTNLSPPNASPHPVTYTLSDGTSCPLTGCFYRLDPTSGTWILNVDTSTLTGGGTEYFGTTFDDSHQIPSFSNTTSGFAVDIFTLN